MSDELDRFASDEGEEESSEDVEAHRRHGGGMTDDRDSSDDSDDVEAHRRHGGS